MDYVLDFLNSFSFWSVISRVLMVTVALFRLNEEQHFLQYFTSSWCFYTSCTKRVASRRNVFIFLLVCSFTFPVALTEMSLLF